METSHSKRVPFLADFISYKTFTFISIFLLVQIISRSLGTTVLDLDEAEQAFCSQALNIGYGPQPPLYSWLQWFVCIVFGRNVTALIVLKVCLLFGIFYLSVKTAFHITKSHLSALTALSSLLMMPQIFWESLRDLSHSILATVAVAGVWWTLIGKNRANFWQEGILLGLWIGIGLLAKPNFIVFISSCFLVWMLHPKIRPLLGVKTWIIGLITGILLSSPYWYWVFNHHEFAFQNVNKLDIKGLPADFSAISKSVLNFLKATFTHVGLLLGIWAITTGKYLKNLLIFWKQKDPSIQWLMWQSVSAVLFLFIFCSFTGASGFRDRWLMPICLSIPIYFGIVGSRILSNRGWAIITAWTIIITLSISIAYAIRFNFPEKFHQWRLAKPIDKLPIILKEKYPEADVIICENTWLAGNLSLGTIAFPANVVDRPFIIPTEAKRLLLIWELEQPLDYPESIRSFLKNLGISEKSLENVDIIRIRGKSSTNAVVHIGVLSLNDVIELDSRKNVY